MKVLSFKQLRAQKGIEYCDVHLARLEAAGKFPKRIKLGDHRVAWIEAEVDRWLRSKVQARDVGAAPEAAHP